VRCLHSHQQRVERCDVHTDRVVSGFERLHERRSRPCEGIEHTAAGTDIAPEQRLDELRDKLAEVRVQPMDVLRPLPLWELGLRPRKLEIVGELRVERGLCRRHACTFDGRECGPTPDA